MNILKMTLLTLIITSCGAPDNKRNDNNDTIKDQRGVQTDTPVNPVISSLSQTFRNTDAFISNKDLVKYLRKDNQKEIVLVPNEDKHTDDQDTKENINAPLNDCGLEEKTSITTKVEDCNGKNKSQASFIASEKGMMGEVNWNLVLKNDSLEIWKDSLTGALWSYPVDSVNWNNLFDRSESSICAKNTIENKNLLNSIKDVQWRVPTHKDLAAAEINGLSYALRGQDLKLWSMTTDSSDPTRALLFSLKDFSFTKVAKDQPHSVMCIGHAL